jgi:xanthine dehydrogenase accessory factor
MLIEPDGDIIGTIGGTNMERWLVTEAQKALKTGRSTLLTFALGVKPKSGAITVNSQCGGEVKVFLDVIRPNLRLIIVGSGHIAKPLAELAHRTGFDVIVVDDAVTATKERFPPSTAIYSGRLEEELERVGIGPLDFIAIVHGDPRHELVALSSVLHHQSQYIGLLGSQNKITEYKKQLLTKGFSEEEIDKINGPIGLDIGAETPEEIAISIMAEIISKRRVV